MSSIWHDWECNPQLTAITAIKRNRDLLKKNKKERKKETEILSIHSTA